MRRSGTSFAPPTESGELKTPYPYVRGGEGDTTVDSGRVAVTELAMSLSLAAKAFMMDEY